MKTFTTEELQQHRGQNGTIYIACNGKVYDVSSSFHWRTGRHHAAHSAGADLTEALHHAPHGEKLLDKFPVIGLL